MSFRKFTIFLLVFPCFIFSQKIENDTISRKKIQAIKIENAPKIDGILDEDVWKNAPEAQNFVERNPNNGNPISKEFHTTVKILYDNTGIYFGAQLNDPEPEKIAKEMTERDEIQNDDLFGVLINGYNDHQQSMEFLITAAGVQNDAKLTNDYGEDFSWNGVWFSAVTHNENGWTVEFKIPYSELRFPKNNVENWGLNMIRLVKRSNTMYDWNFVDNKKGNYLLYEGVLQGISNVKTPTRLSFLPYFSTYANNYDGETSVNVNGGMDVKYGINDAFTFDMTLIPDFGQANFDNVVLNLGPFEQQFQENRSFFTEGTELFNKGNLFYSRRVGGNPSRNPTLSESEEILENPEKVKLFNAFKISGRTEKGLGIGIFNGVTEKMEAKIVDTETGQIRKEITEPWANYNVLVFDQRFNDNSSVSFVNTSVLREGNFRDANVSAILFDLTNKKNKFNVWGNVKESIVNQNAEMKYGTEANFGMGKISGSGRYSFSASYRDKNYDIDDLGFTGGNNYHSYFANYNYRFLKPRGNINNLNYNVNINLDRRIEPEMFYTFGVHQTLSITNKKFQEFGMGLWVKPFGEKNIYEPRTFGRHLELPAMVNPWIWYNSDNRKKFMYGGYTEIYVYDSPGRTRYVTDLDFRYRFSDRFSTEYSFYTDIHKNDLGFAGKSGDEIFMGQRNVNTFENSLSSKYIFNEKMMMELSFRHYVSAVDYNQFYTLNQNGTLNEIDPLENRNGTYNFWNVDLRYSWWFAPGSQLTLLYRNAADSYQEIAKQNVKENFRYFFDQPMLNMLSLKITYFLDYNRAKNWFNKS